MNNKIKPIALIILVIFLLLVSWYAISKVTKENTAKSDSRVISLQVKNIQGKIQSINSEKDYQIKTLNNEEFLNQMTDGGGQLIGYFKNGQISKISEKLGLSYGVKTYEYYFDYGQLILVYEKEEYFPYDNNNGSLDQTKLEFGFEGYYYFDKERLIETQTKGEKRFPEDSKTNVEVQLLNFSKEDVDLLSR